MSDETLITRFDDPLVLEDKTDLMENLTQNLIKGAKPPEMFFADLREYIPKRMLDAIVESDYDLAQQLQIALLKITPAYEINRPESEKLAHRKETVEKSIVECNARWERRFQRFEARRKRTIKALIEEQKKEELEFEEFCQSSKFLQQFQKPSRTLIEWRVLQRRRADAKEYDSAKDIKDYADEIQELETEEASNRALDSAQMGYERLQAKHERQIRIINERFDFKREKLEIERLQELEILKNTVKSIDIQTEMKRAKSQRAIPPVLAPPKAVNGHQTSDVIRTRTPIRLRVKKPESHHELPLLEKRTINRRTDLPVPTN